MLRSISENDSARLSEARAPGNATAAWNARTDVLALTPVQVRPVAPSSGGALPGAPAMPFGLGGGGDSVAAVKDRVEFLMFGSLGDALGQAVKTSLDPGRVDAFAENALRFALDQNRKALDEAGGWSAENKQELSRRMAGAIVAWRDGGKSSVDFKLTPYLSRTFAEAFRDISSRANAKTPASPSTPQTPIEPQQHQPKKKIAPPAPIPLAAAPKSPMPPPAAAAPPAPGPFDPSASAPTVSGAKGTPYADRNKALGQAQDFNRRYPEQVTLPIEITFRPQGEKPVTQTTLFSTTPEQARGLVDDLKKGGYTTQRFDAIARDSGVPTRLRPKAASTPNAQPPKATPDASQPFPGIVLPKGTIVAPGADGLSLVMLPGPGGKLGTTSPLVVGPDGRDASGQIPSKLLAQVKRKSEPEAPRPVREEPARVAPGYSVVTFSDGSEAVYDAKGDLIGAGGDGGGKPPKKPKVGPPDDGKPNGSEPPIGSPKNPIATAAIQNYGLMASLPLGALGASVIWLGDKVVTESLQNSRNFTNRLNENPTFYLYNRPTNKKNEKGEPINEVNVDGREYLDKIGLDIPGTPGKARRDAFEAAYSAHVKSVIPVIESRQDYVGLARWFLLVGQLQQFLATASPVPTIANGVIPSGTGLNETSLAVLRDGLFAGHQGLLNHDRKIANSLNERSNIISTDGNAISIQAVGESKQGNVLSADSNAISETSVRRTGAEEVRSRTLDAARTSAELRSAEAALETRRRQYIDAQAAAYVNSDNRRLHVWQEFGIAPEQVPVMVGADGSIVPVPPPNSVIQGNDLGKAFFFKMLQETPPGNARALLFANYPEFEQQRPEAQRALEAVEKAGGFFTVRRAAEVIFVAREGQALIQEVEAKRKLADTALKAVSDAEKQNLEFERRPTFRQPLDAPDSQGEKLPPLPPNIRPGAERTR